MIVKISLLRNLKMEHIDLCETQIFTIYTKVIIIIAFLQKKVYFENEM